MLNKAIEQSDLDYLIEKHVTMYYDDVEIQLGSLIGVGVVVKAVPYPDATIQLCRIRYINNGTRYKTMSDDGSGNFTVVAGGSDYLDFSITSQITSIEPEPEPEPEPELLTVTQELLDYAAANHFTMRQGFTQEYDAYVLGNTIIKQWGYGPDDGKYYSEVLLFPDDGYHFVNGVVKMVDSEDVEYSNTLTNANGYGFTNVTVAEWNDSFGLKPIVDMVGGAIADVTIVSEITSEDLTTISNNNCSLLIDDNSAIVGDSKRSVTMKIVADVGYLINSVSLLNSSGVSPSNFFVAADYMSATLNTTGSIDYTSFVLDVIEETDEPVILGTSSLYAINNDILEDVNSKRFVVEDDNSITDYGEYILGIRTYKFAFPDSAIGDIENIVLGNRRISTQAETITDDIITIDLGEIEVLGTNGNLLDYAETKALLHLPFSTPIDIDLNYLIDQTISVEYLISCFSGDAVINVKSTKTGEVISTTSTKIGSDLPYINGVGWGVDGVTNVSTDYGGDNGVRIPFIELVKTDVILANGFFTIPITDENILGGESGYIVVENIDLSVKATKREVESIKSILNNGVIIR